MTPPPVNHLRLLMLALMDDDWLVALGRIAVENGEPAHVLAEIDAEISRRRGSLARSAVDRAT
jgi:hypothetical protein